MEFIINILVISIKERKFLISSVVSPTNIYTKSMAKVQLRLEFYTIYVYI